MRQPTDATLRQLRYFSALAEELHFGRTAASLGISQPALTRQIQTLEQFVGAPLLERTQRSVSLTAAGTAFAERARETLSNHDRSLEAARNAAVRDGDSLAIGFEPCAPLHNFPSVVLQFLGRYPGTKLASFRMSGPEQAEALIRHRIDLGFVHPPVPDQERFIFDALAEERFIAAVPSTHRLASKKRVRVAELAEEKFMLYPRKLAPGCYDAVQRICQSAGFVPRVVHESNEISVALTLIPVLGAVTLFPECVRSQAAPGVVYRNLAGSVTTVTSGFLRRSGKAAPAISRFLRLWRTVREGRT
jgi:DNA-binding transcriptional LysR family regulator